MANIYRYLRKAYPESYRVDTSGSNNVQLGDMLQWDGAGPYAKAMVAGQEQYFIGVSDGVAPTPTSNIDNASGKIDSVLVYSHGIFSFKTTVGESYNHGDPVKCGADAQTVSSAAVTTGIGYVWRPLASAALTGASGVEVDVAIVSRFPASGQDLD